MGGAANQYPAAMHSSPAMVIVCRRPALGVGKQRLAASLGAAAAWDIGARLLDYALEDATHWPGPVILAPAEASDARCAWPPLADLPWSSADLGAALRQRCIDHGLTLSMLADSFDIDEVADLLHAVAALANDPRPARRALCALLRSLPLPRAH